MHTQDGPPPAGNDDASAKAGALSLATPWTSWGAAGAVVLILACGLMISGALAAVGAVAGIEALLVLQIVLAVAVVLIVDQRGGRRRELLSLGAMPPLQAWAVGIGVMAAVLVPFNVAVWLISPETLTRDLQPFIKLARSEQAWVALVAVGIGAPVSEELMFRGFLLPALAKVRQLGFIGAALITTAGWTLLHFSYSVLGLAEVFTIGLVFCWLMWRFGNLWLVMGLHAIYNAGQMIALMVWPF